MEEYTIFEIQEKMQAGELTSRQFVEAFIERIEQIDRQGPAVNAVIEINPDAIAIADELDAERRSGGRRGLLHGVPILVKDNIDTADRMTTTAGSLALEGSIASEDAFIIQNLRQAGVVILGKTNLSEWANFRSSHSTSGWSSRGGQTRNPYALDRNPCGSSSGSAAAVAACFCVGAIGTETDGSIICPSHANGIVGIKPTVGLVSRSGIIPISYSQDTAGPMARTVADAAILLGAMAGADDKDLMTQNDKRTLFADYTRFLDPKGMNRARIGVARNFFGFHTEVDNVMEASLSVMKNLGAEIVDPVNIETAEKTDDTEIEVLHFEFKASLNQYLSKLPLTANVHSLKDVIEFNDRNKGLVMPYFGQDRMLKAEEKGPLSEEAYLKALATNHRLARDEGIDAVLRKEGLDAIVAPSGGPAWLIDWVNGDHYSGGSSSPAAVAGYPNITVPAGYVHGLPIGISFFASAYQEPILIRLAYAFERATQVRRPPQFLPSVIL